MEDTSKQEVTTLVVNQQQEHKLSLNDSFTNVEDVFAMAKHFITSKAIPPGYNTPEKVMVGVARAKELGLTPLAGLSNLHLINGVPTPSTHLLVALAKKANVMFELIRDGEKIFETVLDGNGMEVLDENGKPKVKPDLITTVRVSQYKLGRWFSSDISYRWSEAVAADLVSKDNWKKMGR